MKRLLDASILLLGLAVAGLTDQPADAADAADAADRPNVIVIMTDDQGYGDLGATGNPVIETPNIDAMAKRSGSMANFYVSPVCSPTRACLNTGRYNYRTRVIDTWVGRSMMDPEEVTTAEILGEAGYATGIFGKWHLGDNYPLRPMDQGFQESLVHRGGGIGQPADPPGGEGKYTDPILLHNGTEIQTKGYCTDVYFDAAMKWIKNSKAEEKPFFIYLPTNAPHGPFDDVPQRLLERYRVMNLENDAFPQDRGHKLPPESDVDKRARVFAMVTNVDENVGRLFKKLDALELTENTMVVFMVDNGPNGRRYVAGMRGMKAEVHEGGIRSPFFMQWPSRVTPGVSSDVVAAHIDLLPTVLDACGVAVPQGLKLDGRSFLPLLTGQTPDWPDRTIFIQSHRGNQPVAYHNFAARAKRWKLLHASGFSNETFKGKPKFELYDLEADPLELNDVAADHPVVVEQMLKEYDAWFADVGSTRADNYAPPRIHIGTPHENPTVLTRQDWRHAEGKTWAPTSNGYWLLHAEKAAYDVRLSFPALEAESVVTLEFGDQKLNHTAPIGATECLFQSISLEAGNVRLMGTIASAGSTQGPWHVGVSRK